KPDQQRQIDDHEPASPLDDPADASSVSGGDAVKATVEPAEKALPHLMPLGNRLEDRRAKGRRQRQGEEAGEQDRDDHGQAELLIDDTDRTWKERHGYEDGGQNQGDADDRP